MMPLTRPTVAMPTARSAPSLNPSLVITSRMPAAVPWPPSKPISINPPVIGDDPKNGTIIRAASSRPTTYCEDANAVPNAS